ncbi:MAG: phosphatase PAP2 family protein [Planctomycetes bacterium]|nr:phosphatase PAP2 family protein [Planctomycetota bacterium]
MRTTKPLGWGLAAVAAVALAGCSGAGALNRQAEQTYQRVAAAAPADAQSLPALWPADAPRAAAGRAEAGTREAVPRQVLFFAPRMEPAPLDPVPPLAAADAKSPAGPTTAGAAAAAEEKAPKVPEFAPLPGETFGQVVKSDLLGAPRKIWSGTKYTFGNTTNLIILGAAFGADRVARENLDGHIRAEFRNEKGSLAETGDFGSVAGNPFLHFGIAAAWYGISVDRRDVRNYSFSKTMIEALVVNDLWTMLFKAGMGDHSPNGEWGGWPSGHMSSSVAFASVVHEYYGWGPAIPLYLLSGYVGATRLQDREHDFSDLVFGAALGWCVGHSVVKGELPQIGGFTALPYGGNGVGGLMFVKQW